MATATAVQRDPALPTSKQFASVATRITERVGPHGLGIVATPIARFRTMFDRDVEWFDSELRNIPRTEDQRIALGGKRWIQTNAESLTIEENSLAASRQHREQLRAELAEFPRIADSTRAAFIWTKLHAMEPRALDHFLAQSDDPELTAAVLGAPSAFPIGTDEARARLLANYNSTHRAEKVKLADELETAITAVEGFRDLVMRELRRVLR